MNETDKEFCAQAVAYLKRALPGAGPAAALPHEDTPVLTDLKNGLLVTYVVDKENRFQYVQHRHLADAGLSTTDMHLLGIKKLSAILNENGANVRPYENIFAVTFGGNFEASLILIDDLWNNALMHMAPNGFIVAVPRRDILAFCDAGNASGIQELRNLIQRVENGDHPISSILYQRHETTWKPYSD